MKSKDTQRTTANEEKEVLCQFFHDSFLGTTSIHFYWFSCQRIDLLAIQLKSLDRAIFLYIFIREVRLNGVRASIAIVHIRKFYKMQ